jgi:Barstar (barnase inhibitor)
MSFDLSPLIDASNVQPFWKLIGDRKNAVEFRSQCESQSFFWQHHHLTVRRFTGNRMMTKAALMAEFDSVLQFREGGGNWDALDDWVTYMGWLKPNAGYLFLITDAAKVLHDEPSERATLVEILRYAAMGWASVVTEGAWRGRPAVPFHVVLADESEEALARAWGADLPSIAPEAPTEG